MPLHNAFSWGDAQRSSPSGFTCAVLCCVRVTRPQAKSTKTSHRSWEAGGRGGVEGFFCQKLRFKPKP